MRWASRATSSQPHPPGTKLVPNGLPVFSIYYENDDDAHRELGKDSRLFFTAPADGEYLVKVKDVRGFQGPDFRYTLTVRERRPDFKVTLSGANPTVDAGSAKEFKVSAQRIDGFEGPIRVDIAGVPPGFRVTTPLIIEAGQLEALGVIEAEAGAKPPPASRPSEQGHGDGSGRRSRRHARGQQPGDHPACGCAETARRRSAPPREGRGR